MKIKVDNVTKRIKTKTVLSNISLEMESGKIYGFKGPNGCGKTMLMRAITGLITPTRGKIFIDDKELGKELSFPDSLGLLLEYPSFINGYTGFKNLKLIAAIKNRVGDDEIRDAISAVGLDPDDKRTFRKYSLGMKQKLGIASAIMENPDLLVLDEPFNALDDKSIENVKKLIVSEKEKGKLIIMSCHDKDLLYELSDEIIVMAEGEIVE